MTYIQCVHFNCCSTHKTNLHYNNGALFTNFICSIITQYRSDYGKNLAIIEKCYPLEDRRNVWVDAQEDSPTRGIHWENVGVIALKMHPITEYLKVNLNPNYSGSRIHAHNFLNFCLVHYRHSVFVLVLTPSTQWYVNSLGTFIFNLLKKRHLDF